MKYKAIKEFSSSYHGNVSIGDPIDDLPEGIAIQWLAAGMIERVGNAKKQTEAPSSASQADQVSPKKTRTSSKRKTAKSSRSTPASKQSKGA